MLLALVLGVVSSIPPSQAKQYIGKEATVCGYVADTKYDTKSRHKTTFLNFEKPYPDQTFTAVIYQENRVKFGQPEEKYLHKNICVSGKIDEYQGKPQTIVWSITQISIDDKSKR
jgi:hypothetical protein